MSDDDDDDDGGGFLFGKWPQRSDLFSPFHSRWVSKGGPIPKDKIGTGVEIWLLVGQSLHMWRYEFFVALSIIAPWRKVCMRNLGMRYRGMGNLSLFGRVGR